MQLQLLVLEIYLILCLHDNLIACYVVFMKHKHNMYKLSGSLKSNATYVYGTNDHVIPAVPQSSSYVNNNIISFSSVSMQCGPWCNNTITLVAIAKLHSCNVDQVNSGFLILIALLQTAFV